MSKIFILGIGNSLMKDDGLGIHAINALQQNCYSQDIEYLDIGCSLLDLINVIEQNKEFIVIDAIRAGGVAGTVYRFEAGEIEVSGGPHFGLHELGLAEVITIIKHKGKQPKLIVFGIEPEEVGYGLELSATVTAALPKLVEAVIQEINVLTAPRPCS